MGGEFVPGPIGINPDETSRRGSILSPMGGFSFPGPIGISEKAEKLDASKPTGPAILPPPATVVGTSKINGIDVATLADGTDANIVDGHTSFKLDKGTIPGYEWSGPKKVITKLTGPAPAIKATIQTFYGPNAKSTGPSGYGRGTTSEDKKKGEITLGFHESCHRKDYVDFMTANSLPKFSGKVGMTENEYEKAENEYFAAVDDYLAKALKYSEAMTDEVGSPTLSQFRAKKGP